MKRRSKGVTLIMVAGVLSVLAALSTGFYISVIMQTRSATRFADSVRAEMMARAGIQDAVSRLLESALNKPEDPTDAWYTVNYFNGAKKRVSFAADMSANSIDDDLDGKADNDEEKSMPFSCTLGSSAGLNSDRYVLNVSDAASRISINAGDNLAVILDNLCRAIGAPLVAADQDALQPRRWFVEGASAGLFDNTANANDLQTNRNIYYWHYDQNNAMVWDGFAKNGNAVGRPATKTDGTALYGDGYAIAGYRARYGAFQNIEDVKSALTYVERNNNNIPDTALEQLEIEVKFAAIRDYITLDSWVDTTTVCVGKFEWIDGTSSGLYDIAIDRDKSWIADDPVKDPKNHRGSLRGCYVSVMNGHGAGQFRRIKTNGADWIQLDTGFEVPPGPISSYMIIARPDAKPDPFDPNNGIQPNRLAFKPLGDLEDDPNIDYVAYPLCFHRAPVNINTASDKVLTALFMGINVQHGHPMAVATDVDRQKIVPYPLNLPPAPATASDWKTLEYSDRKLEPYLLTLKGLKRIPADKGQVVFDRSIDDIKLVLPPPLYDLEYLNNYGCADPMGTANRITEAHELAIRVISARQRRTDPATNLPMVSDPDPFTADADTGFKGYERGPFRSWDDFFFRIVKPWDDIRSLWSLPDPLLPGRTTIPNSGIPGKTAGQGKISVARMIMAQFNSNADILKFNPNIEWIDRWGRNFTEMEPVMIFDAGANEPTWVDYAWPATAASDGMWNSPAVNSGKRRGAYYTRSMRYKSDELIDKTDLNRSTTEFSFESGGIYEIQSIGQVQRRGEMLSERKLQALVKVYDVWRESTQDQFTRGTISAAINGDPATRSWTVTSTDNPGSYSGRVVRDSSNGTTQPLRRLALDTLPEPLVPASFTLSNAGGISDLVDTSAPQGRDAWGAAKKAGMPDIVANRVLPATYDGQIVLATNTAIYDTGSDSTTFLSSFNGDLDTDTSAGNGREQAKSPVDRKIRVIDTVGLLGRLDDAEIDFDPKEGTPSYDVFAVKSANKVMRALDKSLYWENVTCRMGDLRADGAFLGNVGVSGKDATLKYPVAANWPLASAAQGTISMWMKPNWHVSDGQEHEFFNAVGIGDGYSARGNHLRKNGKFTGIIRYGVNGSSNGGGGGSMNSLSLHTEDKYDSDMICSMHGGVQSVPSTVRESPSFRTQPFRWSFVGCVMKYKVTMTTWPWSTSTHDDAEDSRGRWQRGGGSDARNLETAEKIVRPFICTARQPEGADWNSNYLDSKTNRNPMLDTDVGTNANIAQEAAWSWADGATTNKWIFGANNLNKTTNKWLYRSSPIDGTQATVDEFKLSKVMWDTNRIGREMTTSRYYLPPDPRDASQCPTFTSQTLLQSMKGFDKTTTTQEVSLVRVSWNCFTPRFMHENKVLQNARTRVEMCGDRGIASKQTDFEYRGPYDYIQYNWEILPRKSSSDSRLGEPDFAKNAPVTVLVGSQNVPVLGVDRPAPLHYLPNQEHSTNGIEVELLRDPDGVANSGDEVVIQQTFKDPNAANSIGKPTSLIKVKTNQLRYRVRFRYPVDPLVRKVYDPASVDKWVDPEKHYLLDTPVFDDISVTYFSKPRILSYKEVVE